MFKMTIFLAIAMLVITFSNIILGFFLLLQKPTVLGNE